MVVQAELYPVGSLIVSGLLHSGTTPVQTVACAVLRSLWKVFWVRDPSVPRGLLVRRIKMDEEGSEVAKVAKVGGIITYLVASAFNVFMERQALVVALMVCL